MKNVGFVSWKRHSRYS